MNARVSAGILGAADGVTSISGVIAGAAAAGVGHAAIAVTAIGGALAATVSMAGAELLSEDSTDWSAIGAMAAGTLLGSALPAVPLLALKGSAAWIAVLVVAVVIGLLVALVRAEITHRSIPKAAAQTLGILTLGGLVGYGAGRFL